MKDITKLGLHLYSQSRCVVGRQNEIYYQRVGSTDLSMSKSDAAGNRAPKFVCVRCYSNKIFYLTVKKL